MEVASTLMPAAADDAKHDGRQDRRGAAAACRAAEPEQGEYLVGRDGQIHVAQGLDGLACGETGFVDACIHSFWYATESGACAGARALFMCWCTGPE
jgi:hypothetical protein